jgi:transposase-like protein
MNGLDESQLYYTLNLGDIMVQKKEFSNIHKQLILSSQKHKCKNCERKFNVANLPEFGYIDGNVSNNTKSNLQVLCMECLENGKKQ